MSKKYTIDKVKYIFLQNNFELIDTQYINTGTPLLCFCKVCGTEQYKRLNDIRKNSKCTRCTKNYVPSLFEVIIEYWVRGFKYLDSKYINNRVPSKCQCLICNKIQKKSRDNLINKNAGCKCCYSKIQSERMKKFGNHNYINNRSLVKELIKIRKKMRSNLNRYLNLLDEKKLESSYNILGYTPKELYLYLNSFPEYKILKESTWHLDHKVPICVCLDLNIKDPKIVNSLYNLQPLSAEENIKKSYRSNKTDIIKLLTYFNLPINENKIDDILNKYGVYYKKEISFEHR